MTAEAIFQTFFVNGEKLPRSLSFLKDLTNRYVEWTDRGFFKKPCDKAVLKRTFLLQIAALCAEFGYQGE
jgi:hypothetical protein